ncbi:MAG TPA: response regulator [Ignavibacteriaceae bacterium]|nr:response regulator [Ignavibacteriaceae bacterium]
MQGKNEVNNFCFSELNNSVSENLPDLLDEINQLNGRIKELEEIENNYKKLNDELQQERILLKTLINNLPDAIFAKDREYRKILTNNTDLQNIGCKSETEILGKTDFELFPKEIAEKFVADDKSVIEDGLPIINRKEYQVNSDGEKRWMLTSKLPLKNHEGNIIGLIGIARDITELVNTNEILQVELEKFKSIFENAFDGISIFEENYEPGKRRLVECNERYAEMSGRSREELLRIGNLPDSGLAKNLIDNSENINQGIEFKGTFSWIRPDEKENVIEYTAVPIKLKGKAYTIGIDRDITVQKKTEEKLRNANAELEQKNIDLEKANKVKGQFLANMSHEIRTPLNAIVGMSGLLLNTQLNDEQKDYAQTIVNSGDILLSLINNILDFSKIEAQKIELEQQPFDIRTCIEEALDLMAPKALEKNLELTYFMDGGLPSEVIGDITRLRQILVNLVSNAIKFTESGEVVISVSGQLKDNFEYKLHFVVKDTGLGISPDNQNKLFNSFSQVDSSTTRKFGGTGLGLAISKQLCELMNGQMWMESTGVKGEGSVFHFTIFTQLSNVKKILNDISALKEKRVLIVDDNQTNREILVKQTHSLNMIPTAASSGQNAIELLQKGAMFDLAILDYQMPVMDGITLSENIRLINSGKELPLILLSSCNFNQNTRASEFAAILTKPTKLARLHDALITVLSKNSLKYKKQEFVKIKVDPETGKKYPLKILLAEDNFINQKVALRFLEKIGYKADVAFNGIEVMSALQLQRYDVILMDIQMPDLDGEQATLEIRKLFPEKHQPRIIAVTANAMKDDIDRYLLNGMDDSLIKPFKIESLVRVLTESYIVLSNRGSRKINL